MNLKQLLRQIRETVSKGDAYSQEQVRKGAADGGYAGPMSHRLGGPGRNPNTIKHREARERAKAAIERLRKKIPGATMSNPNAVEAGSIHRRKYGNEPPVGKLDNKTAGALSQWERDNQNPPAGRPRRRR
jgi:hypothetical protein